MLEIRVVVQPPITRRIKLDSKWPGVKSQVPGDPIETIEQLYVSKSDIRYKKNAKNLEIVSASGFGLELRAPWSDFNIVGLFGKPQTSTFSKYTVCLGFHHCSQNGGYDTDFDLASSQFWRKVKPPNTNITFVPLLFSGVSINTRLWLTILDLMNTNSYEKKTQENPREREFGSFPRRKPE